MDALTTSRAILLVVLPLVLAVFESPPSVASPIEGTFSIIGRDSITGEIGIAVQSRAFGVGNAVPWVQAGVGAIATQANTNQSWGPIGLQLLRDGMDVRAMVDTLRTRDPEAASRQLGALDARGTPAGYTGNECLAWAGGWLDWNLAAQGNILAGGEVLHAMVDTFQTNARATLADRLLGALVAGQARGGDKRGMQSAALLVGRPSRSHPEYVSRYISVRVDDHPDPIHELIRLYRIYEGTRLVESRFHFADEYKAAGSELLYRAEVDRVREVIERTLADSGASASSLNGLAWTVATRDLMLPEAERAADRALALEPRNIEIMDTVAEVRFRMGRFDEALELERKAAAMSPEDAYLKKQIARFEAGRKSASTSKRVKKSRKS